MRVLCLSIPRISQGLGECCSRRDLEGVSYVVEADLFEDRGSILGAVRAALLLTRSALNSLRRCVCSYWKVTSCC